MKRRRHWRPNWPTTPACSPPLRVIWRLFNKPPAPPASMTPFQKRLAVLGHVALYAMMAIVPIIGVALTFRRGGTIDFGVFQIVSPFAADRGFFGNRHFSKANNYLQQHGKEPIDW